MDAYEEYDAQADRLEDLPRVARGLLAWIGHERLLRFSSPMGSGKTTLISTLCRELGSNARVSSPTFAIMNEYPISSMGIIYHFDFYRIEDPKDLLELGLDDALCDEAAWRFVEWPAVGEELMPTGGVDVDINVLPNGARRVHAVKRGK